MFTYKLILNERVSKNNEEGKQEHLVVKNAKNKMFPIPCYKMKVSIVKGGLSFDEAKELRREHKGSEIVKE